MAKFLRVPETFIFNSLGWRYTHSVPASLWNELEEKIRQVPGVCLFVLDATSFAVRVEAEHQAKTTLAEIDWLIEQSSRSHNLHRCEICRVEVREAFRAGYAARCRDEDAERLEANEEPEPAPGPLDPLDEPNPPDEPDTGDGLGLEPRNVGRMD